MKTNTTTVNGIDTQALLGAIEAIRNNPAEAQSKWHVTSHWKGGTRSETKVKSSQLGNQTIAKDFTIGIDEPLELCGTNQFANPQEYLMAALNACMIVGYTALTALEGIELEELRIETEGEIDIQGFLGLDPSVKPGYDHLRYTVHLKGDGTPEQFERIHRTVMATSPNYFNVANAVPLKSKLVLESPATV
ncbi:OsmC family protein [Luteolibacter soli]|uniref:OsmC family protein n=1 Tax=Luteolibacter soli TaxID=3135280 RepID=A0ABU9B3A3_9BACT